MQVALEILLIGLLIATLVHAVRLGRALSLLKADRAPLEELVNGFAASTKEAQAGIERLRQTADGAGRKLAQQTEVANGLRGDLTYMIERAERLADRLDQAIRAGRPLETPARPVPAPPAGFQPGFAETAAPAKVRSQAERDLMQALRLSK